MTHSDPDSSQEYNPYELFPEELDLDSFGLEQPPSVTVTDLPLSTQDEDRLYTDEVIRRSELASRSLFISVITAAVISLGIGLWYLVSQQKTTPQPTPTPLPVPEQPLTVPSPGLTAPGLSAPGVPSVPLTPSSPSLPNLNPGSVPGTIPRNNSTLPAPSNSGSAVTAPNPATSVQVSPSGAPPPPPTGVSTPGVSKNSDQ